MRKLKWFAVLAMIPTAFAVLLTSIFMVQAPAAIEALTRAAMEVAHEEARP